MNRRGFLRSLLVAAALTIAPAMPVSVLNVVDKPFVRRRGWGIDPHAYDELVKAHQGLLDAQTEGYYWMDPRYSQHTVNHA